MPREYLRLCDYEDVDKITGPEPCGLMAVALRLVILGSYLGLLFGIGFWLALVGKTLLTALIGGL